MINKLYIYVQRDLIHMERFQSKVQIGEWGKEFLGIFDKSNNIFRSFKGGAVWLSFGVSYNLRKRIT